jgi:hypothetical protein
MRKSEGGAAAKALCVWRLLRHRHQASSVVPDRSLYHRSCTTELIHMHLQARAGRGRCLQAALPRVAPLPLAFPTSLFTRLIDYSAASQGG